MMSTQQKMVEKGIHPVSFSSSSHDDEEVKRELSDMGIDVFEPVNTMEREMAEAFDAFSHFVLKEEPQKCEAILEKHMSRGGDCVGALQGGNETYEIYRVLISSSNQDLDENDTAASSELLSEFHACYSGYTNMLTKKRLHDYMLSVCSSRGIKKLGNIMFILSFGPVVGQVRHIDNMISNVQVCLYMSRECPSTILYSLEGPTITNSNELLEHWETNHHHKYETTPDLIQTLLHDKKHFELKRKWYTKFFQHWNTIDTQLKCFGKLYQTVLRPLSLTVDPGTTLIAGGNDVHAGPPTQGPRMFAFAIGIPDNDDTEEENNGEVQYSPVLFHLDLCGILFVVMDLEYSDRINEHSDAKYFLLHILVTLLQEYPIEPFDRLLGDDRAEVRDWLMRLAKALKNEANIDLLLKQGINSDTMFYSPDVAKRRTKKKKKKL